MKRKTEAFTRLLNIMDDLRAQCPWDKKQSMESIRYLTIEEVYELGDAILDGDMEEVKKELGDIMLHLVFYAKIASEKGLFDIADVLNGQCEKLIHRHPHIYGDVKVTDADEVSRNWEKLKMKEGRKSVLEGVPRSLPSMVKAIRIQEKAAASGFDWEQREQVLDKVEEELQELRAELRNNDSAKASIEFGDVLFSMVNLSRFLGINPDEALENTNKKFIYRFQYMEEQAAKKDVKLTDMSLSEMEVLWNEAKVNGL
jgi:MazG family protein